MICSLETGVVTIVFTDMVGSTSLFDRHGDDAADLLRRAHFAALRTAVTEHGGREVKSLGDGLMLVFTSAVAAVRCAIAMQRATTGTPVNVAARLCGAAEPGQILGSEVVRQIAGRRVAEMARTLGALRMAGLDDPVAVAEFQ